MFNWQTRNINLPDYIKEIKLSLIKQYGDKNADNILDSFYGSIYAYSTSKDKEILEKQIEKKKKVLKTMEDSNKFLTAINRKKKNINKKIKNIDLMLNNDKILVKKFKEKNAKLSKKIQSILVFKNILEKERDKLTNKYDFLTMLQKPKLFLEYKRDLERQINTFDKDKKINEYVVDLQMSVLEAIEYKIKNENDSDKILSHLKTIRYFKFLKLAEDLYIKDIKKINKKIKSIEKSLVTKLCELGSLEMFTYDIDINYDIISCALNLQTLDLEDLIIELDYKPMTLGIRIYDKNNLEKEQVIKTTRKPDFKIKLRKKIKLFI